MIRILAIMGSPRKQGNTHLLIERLLDAARAAGAETDICMLADLRLRQCDGCHVCWKTGRCAKNDDMQGLYAKLVEADAIILGTPVYWYGPSAIMKAFIDRLVFFNCPEHRAKIRGRRTALVVPFEDTTLETADLLVQMLEKSLAYLEMPLIGQVIVPGVGERGEVLQKPDALAACDDLGRRLAKSDPIV